MLKETQDQLLAESKIYSIYNDRHPIVKCQCGWLSRGPRTCQSCGKEHLDDFVSLIIHPDINPHYRQEGWPKHA